MEITAEAVKALRDKTGVSVMECKKALVEAQGDMSKALVILGERSAAAAAKKQDRALGAGTVGAYVHSTNQIGAMVALSCETDFVAKNAEFVALARDIAMHISAMMPETKEELLTQPFVKDPSKTIADLISSAVQKFGERVDVTAYSRVAIG